MSTRQLVNSSTIWEGSPFVPNQMQIASAASFPSSRQTVLLAPTGSGKTLAYLIPLVAELLQQKEEESGRGDQALVLVPSRELAAQTVDVVRQMRCGLSAAACYGGRPAMDEHRMLRETKPQLVVATPGRCLDHLMKGNLRGETFTTLVIDEFDKCLEQGFQNDMERIISLLPRLNRRFLLSATDSDAIPDFVSSVGKRDFLKLDFLTDAHDAQRIEQTIVPSPLKDKLQTLSLLLKHIGPEQSIVFVNHRESVERVALHLRREGFAVSAFHGGMEQQVRERALFRFAQGSSLTFVATDLAARGLDIESVSNIIHYHLPQELETLVHRNGRTARWESTGRIWYLLGPDETLDTFPNVKELCSNVHLSPAQSTQKPPTPQWKSLYIGKGKKDKISKGDIVGFLSKKGHLTSHELGRVDVGAHWAYAAVASHKASSVIKLVQGEKLKGLKTIIEIAK